MHYKISLLEEGCKMTPMEMFADLIAKGFVTPGKLEPTSLMVPTAYISVPMTLAIATPPIPAVAVTNKKGTQNAKLGSHSKGDSKRKRRAKRIRR
jgi:hypothetical protein